MRICENKKENEKECPYPEINCERHGICCDCVRYHRKHNEKPSCLR